MRSYCLHCNTIRTQTNKQTHTHIHTQESRFNNIDYLRTKLYPPPNIDIKLKRSIRRRASKLIFEEGQVYVLRKDRHVKVITTTGDQMIILDVL